eukprot:364597-Chlamydomonas_euryale.AAC.10
MSALCQAVVQSRPHACAAVRLPCMVDHRAADRLQRNQSNSAGRFGGGQVQVSRRPAHGARQLMPGVPRHTMSPCMRDLPCNRACHDVHAAHLLHGLPGSTAWPH